MNKFKYPYVLNPAHDCVDTSLSVATAIFYSNVVEDFLSS